MPNGILPVPAFKTVPPRTHPPGLRFRATTRLQRNRLDGKLADGADPRTAPELSLRSTQLRSHQERARLANALVEAVSEARRGDPVTVRPRPHRAEVRANADQLLALAARLRDEIPLDVRGAAMAARLVSDRKGPLRSRRGGNLREAIESTRYAMDTRRELAADLRAAA